MFLQINAKFILILLYNLEYINLDCQLEII